MKKILFPEPGCRSHCPHFKIVGAMLSETCYCMKKAGKENASRRRILGAGHQTGVRGG